MLDEIKAIVEEWQYKWDYGYTDIDLISTQYMHKLLELTQTNPADLKVAQNKD